MALYVSFKRFIKFPRTIRAFHSIAKAIKAVKARPAYSRVLAGKSRVGGDVDVSTTIKTNLATLGKNGRKK